MKITTVGIDLAKNVFQVHGVDERGKAVLKKQLKRHQVLVFFSNIPPCLIGMEACGGAHFWARRLQAQGHTVRLMAPQFVKPYVKSNKNDAADAEAICEAVGRPNMRFVPIKNIEQQAALSLHRARQGFIRERTALANRIRGLLAEFGLIIPQGIHHIARRMPQILEDADNECKRAAEARGFPSVVGPSCATVGELLAAHRARRRLISGRTSSITASSAMALLSAQSRRSSSCAIVSPSRPTSATRTFLP
jgi:transposase